MIKRRVNVYLRFLFATTVFSLCGCMSPAGMNNKTAAPANTTDTTYVSFKEVSDAHNRAILEYLNAVYKNAHAPDTLFIGDNDDAPGVEYLPSINKTALCFIKYEKAEKKLEYRNNMVYVNVAGWVFKTKGEFIIVTFFNRAEPQHNCHLYFSKPSRNNLVLDSVKFKFPYEKSIIKKIE